MYSNKLPPEKTGYLKKRGHIRKNWKRRFFILHNFGCLEYQTPEKITKGLLNLEFYTVKEASELDINLKIIEHVIHLIPQKIDIKPYFLSASCEKEKKEWISALSFAAEESKKRSRLLKLDENKPVKIPEFINDTVKANSYIVGCDVKRLKKSISSKKLRTSSLLESANDTQHSSAVAVLFEGPVAGYIVSLLLEHNYKVNILIIQSFLDNPADDICGKWLNKKQLEKISVYTQEYDKCFKDCTSLFIPNSISINTNSICDILQKAKEMNVEFIIKQNFYSFFGEIIDECKENLFFKDTIEGLQLRLITISAVLPFETIFGFYSEIEETNIQIANISLIKDNKGQKISFVSLHDIADLCCVLLLRKYINLPNRNNILIVSDDGPYSIEHLEKIIIENNNNIIPYENSTNTNTDNWEYSFNNLLEKLGKLNCSLEISSTKEAILLLGRPLLTLDSYIKHH